MPPISSMLLTDWKLEKSRSTTINEPTVIDFFSTDWKKTSTYSDLSSLKYFDNKVDLDTNKMYEKFKIAALTFPTSQNDSSKLFETWRSSNNGIHFRNSSTGIVTNKDTLLKIMNTRFEINDGTKNWIILAKKERSYIYLYQLEKIKKLKPHYAQLKKYLFTKKPQDYHRKVVDIFDNLFYEIKRLNIGEHEVIYEDEIPGVISEKCVTNLQELNSAKHIYCDIYETGQFPNEVINYNPIWWSNASLTNAKQCVIGAYDKSSNCLKDIIKFNMDKFIDITKYENLWSPISAWNCLDFVLTFVKNEVNNRVDRNVYHKCIWKFESFPHNKPCITCEPLLTGIDNNYKTTYQPLPTAYFSYKQ